MRKSNFYVYTLAYPDGTVFYVGKGRGNRIYAHEAEARSGMESRKCQIIREIWTQGGKVLRKKVYETPTEQDAYIYEWALINLIHGRETLANFWEGRNSGDLTTYKPVTIWLPSILVQSVRIIAPTTMGEYIRRMLSLGLKSEGHGRSLLQQERILFIETRQKRTLTLQLPLDLLDEMRACIGWGETRQTIVEHFLCCEPAIIEALRAQSIEVQEKQRGFFDKDETRL